MGLDTGQSLTYCSVVGAQLQHLGQGGITMKITLLSHRQEYQEEDGEHDDQQDTWDELLSLWNDCTLSLAEHLCGCL